MASSGRNRLAISLSVQFLDYSETGFFCLRGPSIKHGVNIFSMKIFRYRHQTVYGFHRVFYGASSGRNRLAISLSVQFLESIRTGRPKGTSYKTWQHFFYENFRYRHQKAHGFIEFLWRI